MTEDKVIDVRNLVIGKRYNLKDLRELDGYYIYVKDVEIGKDVDNYGVGINTGVLEKYSTTLWKEWNCTPTSMLIVNIDGDFELPD